MEKVFVCVTCVSFEHANAFGDLAPGNDDMDFLELIGSEAPGFPIGKARAPKMLRMPARKLSQKQRKQMKKQKPPQ